jgi:polyphosphate kinase 2 (PPK2 family)
MRKAPEVEQVRLRSGIRLYRYWVADTRDELRPRFVQRQIDPLKTWELSPIGKASLDRWDDHTEAKEPMVFETDTADAPWTVVKPDDKTRARLKAMRHLVGSLDHRDNDAVVLQPPDPLIIARATQVIGTADTLAATPPALRR